MTLRKAGPLGDMEPEDTFIVDDCDIYSEILPVGSPMQCHYAGKSLYGGFLRKAWGHFLMNSTARLWPLFAGDAPEYDRIVFFPEDDFCELPGGNFREFLQLAGILDRCVVLTASVCSFEELIVPDTAIRLQSHWSGEFFRIFDFVRQSALAATPEIPRHHRLILTRTGWNRNNGIQINVETMERLFTSNGYQAVAPERLTLTELIAAMDGAEEIVSFSGSTAHNFLFAPGKRLVTLERCAANNMYQVIISMNRATASVAVDSYWQPLPVLSTDNLTIYGFTPELMRFARDRGFPGLPEVSGGEAPAGEFRKFLKIYRRHYGYGFPFNPWETDQLSAIAEALEASRPRYVRYLERRYPTLWSDFLSPRVWVRFLRNLRHNVRN